MKETDLDPAIKAIFGQVFEVRPEEITNQTRRGDLERWDSLATCVAGGFARGIPD